jgi:limonene-1,2-epoxide hydrolase
VVRAWSAALNSGDNEAAARLFATGARIEQGSTGIRVSSHKIAVAWNASLPCAGKIVALATEGQTATATFVLSDRKTSRCDAPGGEATAQFRVVDGKIVLWRQTGGSGPPPATDV